MVVNNKNGAKKAAPTKAGSKRPAPKTAAPTKAAVLAKAESKKPAPKAAAPAKVESKKPTPKAAAPAKVESKKPAPKVSAKKAETQKKIPAKRPAEEELSKGEAALPADSSDEEEGEESNFVAELVKEIDSSDEEEEADSSDKNKKVDQAKEMDKLTKQIGGETQEKLKAINEKEAVEGNEGVLFLGRIPKGFYEPAIKAYFSQFGTISRVRMARNRKTGHSKHYAFLEFASIEVAEIAAETMNNYLLSGRLLKCSVVPKDRIHPNMFLGSDNTVKVLGHLKHERALRKKQRNPEQLRRQSGRLLNRENKKREMLASLGIDYEFDGFKKIAEQTPATKSPVKKATSDKKQKIDVKAPSKASLSKAKSQEVKEDIKAPVKPQSTKGKSAKKPKNGLPKKALPKSKI